MKKKEMPEGFKIECPSAKTELTICVADLTPTQIVDTLEVLAGIIRGVRDGYGNDDGKQGYELGIFGNHPFVSANFHHEEWDSENFYGEAFMMSKHQVEKDGSGISVYTIPRKLAEWFKTKKTCCEYFREREAE